MPQKPQRSKPPAKREPKKAPKQPHMEVAVVTVTTWVGSGVVIGAEHWYGRLNGSLAKMLPKGEYQPTPRREEIELEYAINATEARRLNKEAGIRGFGANYTVGETSTRFFSEEKLHVTAVEKARELGYDALFIGDRSTCSPQRCLYGPKMDELNDLFEKWDRLYEDTFDPPEHLWRPAEDAWTRLAFAIGVADQHGGLKLGRC